MRDLRGKAPQAVLEISHVAADINDIRQLPGALFPILSRYLPIESLAIGNFPLRPVSFEWEYFVPAGYDFSDCDLSGLPYECDYVLNACLSGQTGTVVSEEELFDPNDCSHLKWREFMHARTPLRRGMCGNIVKTDDRMLSLSLYAFDENARFGEEEKDFLRQILPILRMVVHINDMRRNSQFLRQSTRNMAENSRVLTVMFDAYMHPRYIPPNFTRRIKPYFEGESWEVMPPSLLNWARANAAPAGMVRPNTGPWTMKRKAANGNELDLRAFAVPNDHNERPSLLIEFREILDARDFSVLMETNLTPREVEAISYLPLGYTNQQIAAAMDIQEITVKKHLGRAGEKLGGASRVEILYRAMRLRDRLLND